MHSWFSLIVLAKVSLKLVANAVHVAPKTGVKG